MEMAGISGTVSHWHGYSTRGCDVTSCSCRTEGVFAIPTGPVIDGVNRYGESEGSPSEEGLTIDSQVRRMHTIVLGGPHDAISQTALDFVRADPILSETKVVSGL
jgi:hypothetical protein